MATELKPLQKYLQRILKILVADGEVPGCPEHLRGEKDLQELEAAIEAACGIYHCCNCNETLKHFQEHPVVGWRLVDAYLQIFESFPGIAFEITVLKNRYKYNEGGDPLLVATPMTNSSLVDVACLVEKIWAWESSCPEVRLGLLTFDVSSHVASPE